MTERGEGHGGHGNVPEPYSPSLGCVLCLRGPQFGDPGDVKRQPGRLPLPAARPVWPVVRPDIGQPWLAVPRPPYQHLTCLYPRRQRSHVTAASSPVTLLPF